jgi:hypothetical protein
MVQTALKKLPYKDIPAVTETYVDGFGSIQADDDGVRIILTVSRPDPPKKGSKLITGYNGTGAGFTCRCGRCWNYTPSLAG